MWRSTVENEHQDYWSNPPKENGRVDTCSTCRLGRAEGLCRLSPNRVGLCIACLSSPCLGANGAMTTSHHRDLWCAMFQGSAPRANKIATKIHSMPGEFTKIKQSAHFKLELVIGCSPQNAIVFLIFTWSFACLTCYSSPPAMDPCWNQHSMSFQCCGFATLSTLHILHSKSAHARNDNSLSTPIRAFNQERQSHFATLPHFENW